MLTLDTSLRVNCGARKTQEQCVLKGPATLPAALPACENGAGAERQGKAHFGVTRLTH